jgi:formamidopyrimidine-DNA glycosylase
MLLIIFFVGRGNVMPELPEMESYRRLLEPRLAGKIITDVHIEREKSINVSPDSFAKAVVGQSIVRVERRAKHLLFHLSSSQVLLLHLMLGGWMYLGSATDKPDRTIQVMLAFGAMQLHFIGLRLGYLRLHDAGEIEQLLSKLGPEPLEPTFTEERLSERLKPLRGTLKSLLVDQSFLSGIGNCYSDEICFDAGLLPARTASNLAPEHISKLHSSMRAVLTDALGYGGYMENALFAGDTLTGSYDSRCRVYDREGEPCVRCAGTIERREISSKKSFYCPNCQQ